MTPTEFLAAALVLVTIYYAWQNRQMVQEMRRARSVAVMPRLAPSIHSLDAGIGWLRVSNIGAGPALDVKSEFGHEPGGEVLRWSAHVVAAGEAHDFVPHTAVGNDIERLDAMTAKYTHFRLKATYSDALGTTYSVNEAVEIREWWATLVKAGRLVNPNYAKDASNHLERIAKGLDKLASEAQQARWARQPKPWKWDLHVRRLPPSVQEPTRRILRKIKLLRPY